jgi:ribonucleoside-diphosphate reductase alpha chain
METRYLRKDERGLPAEAPEDLFRRVARHVAGAERLHGADEARAAAWAERFAALMGSLEFLPNSPTLMNAGRPLGQCAACFVLPVADAVTDDQDEGIFDALRIAALIQRSGGGTGFDFSRLRPAGALVDSTHGRASGPLSFMRAFDAATEAVRQGGFRRGANMGILRVDHPDILEFVEAKRAPGALENFNLSVAVTDEFLRALRGDLPHVVVDPRSGQPRPLEGVSARQLLDRIARAAWEGGEPGLFFVDRAERANPTPFLGKIEATNPCGEQALLPWEACTLGSLNLARFAEPASTLTATASPESRIRWDALAETVALAVRFLDDVIDVSTPPHPRIAEAVRGNRKIGLGVMGWADLLYLLEIPYDRPAAVALGRTLMRFIRDEAWKASQDLARERGPFPNYDRSVWASGKHPLFKAPRPMRNALVTTVAPTGTISILAGCSPGIEPNFSLAFVRNILDGERLPELHPRFMEIAAREGFAAPGLAGTLLERGSCRRLPGIPERWQAVFACAHDVSPEMHLRMQAAFQESTDNGVSKTVNLSRTASVEDVRRVFELAAELDVKGVTVYRDGSRQRQPMALASTAPADLAEPLGRLVSLALRKGAATEDVAKALTRPEACPECGAALRILEGCASCPCGWSRC